MRQNRNIAPDHTPAQMRNQVAQQKLRSPRQLVLVGHHDSDRQGIRVVVSLARGNKVTTATFPNARTNPAGRHEEMVTNIAPTTLTDVESLSSANRSGLLSKPFRWGR